MSRKTSLAIALSLAMTAVGATASTPARSLTPENLPEHSLSVETLLEKPEARQNPRGCTPVPFPPWCI